jgi:hypothetical protein
VVDLGIKGFLLPLFLLNHRLGGSSTKTNDRLHNEHSPVLSTRPFISGQTSTVGSGGSRNLLPLFLLNHQPVVAHGVYIIVLLVVSAVPVVLVRHPDIEVKICFLSSPIQRLAVVVGVHLVVLLVVSVVVLVRHPDLEIKIYLLFYCFCSITHSCRYQWHAQYCVCRRWEVSDEIAAKDVQDSETEGVGFFAVAEESQSPLPHYTS